MALAVQPKRAQRQLEYERGVHAVSLKLTAELEAVTGAEHAAELKAARAEHAAERLLLLGEARRERVAADELITELQGELVQLKRARRRDGARKTLQAAEAARLEAEEEVARVQDHGRAWRRVREEEARAARAEAARDDARRLVDEQRAQLSSRDASRSAEHQEVLNLRARNKVLREKLETYEARSNRCFFEIDPLSEENERLRHELNEQSGELRTALAAAARVEELAATEVALRKELAAKEAERARLAAVAEPVQQRFFKGGAFTAAVDLAIISSLQLGVARGKVPNLFQIFARLFGIKPPGRPKQVPGKWVEGKRTTVERYVLYFPGRTHVQDVAGMMYQLNKLQMGEWLVEYVESDETSCCYLADGAESQQIDYLGTLLARRVDGELQIRALDLAALGGKTAEAQAAAFRHSMAEVVELMEKAELLDARVAELLRRFVPTCSMNDRASTARAAARQVLGQAAGDNDPTCAEHGLVNILEAGRKAMDAVLRDMMNITDEQAAGEADKIKAMRTHVGWFSSPACALIYQVALRLLELAPLLTPPSPMALPSPGGQVRGTLQLQGLRHRPEVRRVDGRAARRHGGGGRRATRPLGGRALDPGLAHVRLLLGRRAGGAARLAGGLAGDLPGGGGGPAGGGRRQAAQVHPPRQGLAAVHGGGACDGHRLRRSAVAAAARRQAGG